MSEVAKWEIPGSTCNCCKRAKRDEESWCETHTSMGISGFTFDFCPECEKNNQAGCDKVMSDCLLKWKHNCILGREKNRRSYATVDQLAGVTSQRSWAVRVQVSLVALLVAIRNYITRRFGYGKR